MYPKNFKIVLWGVSASPYVRKVMVALAEKNISYEHREILPKILLEAKQQPIPAEFIQASPLGKIPALQVDNFAIADSAVICAYLDRKFPHETQLYPQEPEAYAKTLWFERYADVTLTDVIYKKIFMEAVIKPKILNIPGNEEVITQARETELPPLLAYLNQSVTKNTWIASEYFSIADIAIVTQLLALKSSGTTIQVNQYPALSHYLEKVILRSSVHKIIKFS